MKLSDAFIRRTSWAHLRERALFRQLKHYLPKSGTVLDVGSGGGMLALHIRLKTGLDITLLDVVDHNITKQPLTLYDGKTLPFPDDSFDACTVVFVLHHADNPAQIVREALRVSRSRVIVIEDTPQSTFAKAAWKRWDYALNHFFHKDVEVAHVSRSAKEWIKIFERNGGAVQEVRPFRTFWPVLGMYRHSLIVLEK